MVLVKEKTRHVKWCVFGGAPGGDRTLDQEIKSLLLYR